MAVPQLPKGKRSSSNDATESVARKVSMMRDLSMFRCLRFSQYESTYGKDYRSFQRDLQQLRKCFAEAGFTLSSIADRELVELTSDESKKKQSKPITETSLLSAVAIALGEPIVRELGLIDLGASKATDFFQFITPHLAAGSDVADICASLRSACESPTGRACVRFDYPERGQSHGKERTVEPYHIMARSGSFYLVGYDRDRKDWRLFALDRFLSKPVRAGTCPTTRSVPETYTSKDVIGFIKGSKPAIDVTVTLSSRVAATATSRVWQREQLIERHADGSASMTFAVADIDEVIRWALGYAADAQISAPPAAVDRARELVTEVSELYAN